LNWIDERKDCEVKMKKRMMEILLQINSSNCLLLRVEQAWLREEGGGGKRREGKRRGRGKDQTEEDGQERNKRQRGELGEGGKGKEEEKSDAHLFVVDSCCYSETRQPLTCPYY
jgi:hypothetical protein